MYQRIKLIGSALLLVLGFSTHATVIFQDDFESEIASPYALNYTSFANWHVRPNGGSPPAAVDLIQGNQFGIPGIGTGYFVDIDGTSGRTGRLVSKQQFLLETGKQYRLSYDLAGNNRDGLTDWIRASVGNGTSGRDGVTHQLASNEGFSTYSLLFMGNGDSNNTIAFRSDFAGALSNGNYTNQNDNIGLLLDNIKLELVDVTEPGPLTLLALGLLGLVYARQRKV